MQRINFEICGTFSIRSGRTRKDQILLIFCNQNLTIYQQSMSFCPHKWSKCCQKCLRRRKMKFTCLCRLLEMKYLNRSQLYPSTQKKQILTLFGRRSSSFSVGYKQQLFADCSKGNQQRDDCADYAPQRC